MRKHEDDNLQGDKRCRGIMILPSSYSLSVNKPSKAMGAAHGDPGGGGIPMRPVIRAIGTSNTMITNKTVKALTKKGDSGYVVVDDFGAPLRPLRISNNFKRLLAENKLPHIRFHDLRHSVATYMLSMGVPIAEISAWLGHKSVSTTSNIYAHITDDMRIASAKWMDSGYDPNHNGDLKKVTLEKAIQKLFENVMDNGEVKVEQEEKDVQVEHKTNKHGYDYQKYKNEQERNNEQSEERSKFRVIRGRLA